MDESTSRVSDAVDTVKQRMLDWTRSNGLLVETEVDQANQEWDLTDGVRMKFGSEPDISFERNGNWEVVIEIKGGKDPAGALERLGAIKKTFDEAPVGCKNFLVIGVVTTTMRQRLQEMRMERDFEIDSLVHGDSTWASFMNEIFHHSLRIAPEVVTSE